MGWRDSLVVRGLERWTCNSMVVNSMRGRRTIGRLVLQMGDRLPADIPPQYVTGHPGQRSLLPSVGREMSTGQIAVMLCGWE